MYVCTVVYVCSGRGNWKSGTVDARRGGSLGRELALSPIMESRCHPGNLFDNIGARVKMHISYNSVINLDFARSIWWHQLIKSGTEFIYRLCRIGSVAPECYACIKSTQYLTQLSWLAALLCGVLDALITRYHMYAVLGKILFESILSISTITGTQKVIKILCKYSFEKVFKILLQV